MSEESKVEEKSSSFNQSSLRNGAIIGILPLESVRWGSLIISLVFLLASVHFMVDQHLVWATASFWQRVQMCIDNFIVFSLLIASIRSLYLYVRSMFATMASDLMDFDDSITEE